MKAMKIDAPKAYSGTADGKLIKDASYEKLTHEDVPVRIVRESDWRKIMAVVNSLERWKENGGDVGYEEDRGIVLALDALRKHLEKRK